MPGPHDKILADAAKRALTPLGFRRRGRSRVWLADHGWWLTVVEFQPSGWSKGSYLNVAAHWLWSESGVLSFDLGDRIAEFEKYTSDEQFAGAASKLANQAADNARRLAETFISVNVVAETLLSSESAKADPGRISWSIYHAGVAAGLAGRFEKSADMFTRIASTPQPPGSILHSSAERMVRLLGEPATFGHEVSLLVDRQRHALNLSALKAPAF